ncbi:MAG: chromosomal replication initiator protein DnaA [Cytophagales bacterium]|nr:chromosomal replication initiator protein DnaA [Cytophagales bacterium]
MIHAKGLKKGLAKTEVSEAEIAWKGILACLKNTLTSEQLRIWFAPIRPLQKEGKILMVETPTNYFQEWIEGNYLKQVQDAILQVLGETGRLKYKVRTSARTDSKFRQNPVSLSEPRKARPGTQQATIPPWRDYLKTELNPHYTLDNMVLGPSNQMAHLASYTLARNPGTTAFNPLVVYGEVGLGKTHLLQALGNALTEKMPKGVVYVPSNKFVDQFVFSVKNHTMDEFLAFYMSEVKVMIVDDIQFLKGKEKTQEVFFSIFNHLHQCRKQIIISSDTVPRDLDGMDERLLSRFRWGLTVKMDLPDTETRREIIQFKLQQDDIFLPNTMLDYLTQQLPVNVREIEGVLASLVARSVFSKREIDVSLCEEVISSLVKRKKPNKEMPVEKIIRLVAGYFHVSVEDMLSKSRRKEWVIARQIAMYLAKAHTSHTVVSLGKNFGNRDHSTISHAVRKIQKEMKGTGEKKRFVEEIRQQIFGK